MKKFIAFTLLMIFAFGMQNAYGQHACQVKGLDNTYASLVSSTDSSNNFYGPTLQINVQLTKDAEKDVAVMVNVYDGDKYIGTVNVNIRKGSKLGSALYNEGIELNKIYKFRIERAQCE